MAFGILIFIYFVAMSVQLDIINDISTHLDIPQILIGFTLLSWAQALTEFINLFIAAKMSELWLGMTSALGSMIFSFFFIIPAALICKLLKHRAYEVQIIGFEHSSQLMFLPAALISILALFIYW